MTGKLVREEEILVLSIVSWTRLAQPGREPAAEAGDEFPIPKNPIVDKIRANVKITRMIRCFN